MRRAQAAEPLSGTGEPDEVAVLTVGALPMTSLSPARRPNVPARERQTQDSKMQSRILRSAPGDLVDRGSWGSKDQVRLASIRPRWGKLDEGDVRRLVAYNIAMAPGADPCLRVNESLAAL
jgi:hypothetical protein